MNKKSENILGFLELETGPKAISPMNDVFVNYTFGKKQYWETLRRITNIIHRSYMETYPDTQVSLIAGEIDVQTQYPYFKEPDTSRPKTQDAQIDSPRSINFVEFQNDMHPQIPIEVRSAEYFGYSLTRGKDKKATTIWLLNGTVTKLLQGNVFSNYILTDEMTHHPHPNTSSILYVDLKKLAQTNTQAGELAGILTGQLKEPADPEVRSILKDLKKSFNDFKVNMEVRRIMTRAEELEAKGKIEGKAEAQAELLPLLKEKDERIAELEALLAEKASE